MNTDIYNELFQQPDIIPYQPFIAITVDYDIIELMKCDEGMPHKHIALGYDVINIINIF